ncbi:hypothetical protein SSTU70S_05796 [Stutzerimonas stutzeri]
MPALGAVDLRLICGWLVGQFLQLKLELLRLLVRVDAGATEGGQITVGFVAVQMALERDFARAGKPLDPRAIGLEKLCQIVFHGIGAGAGYQLAAEGVFVMGFVHVASVSLKNDLVFGDAYASPSVAR